MTIQESLVPPYADPQDKLYAERTRLLAEDERLRAVVKAAIDVVKGYRNFLVIDRQLADLARSVDALSPPIEGQTG